MKDIKDYLHLYLGCEVESPHGVGTLLSVTNYNHVTVNADGDTYFKTDEVKPILRPLSDIRPKEVANLIGVYDLAVEKANYESPFFQIQYRDENNEQQFKHTYLAHLNPEQFVFLLSNQFDIFELIESGLAIDKTKL